MENFDSPGDVLEYTAPTGGVVSGTPYKIGHTIGVATVTAAQTEKFSFAVEGVVTVSKVVAEPWAEGVRIYYDTGAAKATSVSTGLSLMGIAAAATLNPSATGKVKLTCTGL